MSPDQYFLPRDKWLWLAFDIYFPKNELRFAPAFTNQQEMGTLRGCLFSRIAFAFVFSMQSTTIIKANFKKETNMVIVVIVYLLVKPS